MTILSFSAIFLIMKIWPVKKLDSLSKKLDIFDRKKKPDPGLVKAGLYPPLPVAGSFLIHGFTLLEKAKELGIKELPVVEFPDMEKKELLVLCLMCEDRAGDYSWPEMERMIAVIPTKKMMDKRLVILIRGHDDPCFFDRITTYREFPPLLKQFVADNVLDFRTAEEVTSLPDTVFSSIFENKDKKRLTFSQVRIFLVTLYEIARRDLLPDKDITKVCDELLSQERPLEAVKKMRMPTLTRLYEQLDSIKEQTIKGTGIQLDEPAFFEGDSFRVQFYFQSKKQLEKRIKVLEILKERTDELFGLL
ncbi:MAG: hypothetical protein JXB88_18050 [Spirochaetales bacterium]|nr:hypothetical protein [Spirochaetales bacterium]